MTTRTDEDRPIAGRVAGLVGAGAAPVGYLLGVSIWLAGSAAGLSPATGPAPYVEALAMLTFGCWAAGLAVCVVASGLALSAAASAKSGGRVATGLGASGCGVGALTLVVMVATVLAWGFWRMTHMTGSFL